ncbi:MAG: PPK2 family polyphosphate kinase [Acidimicrobiales bacterium]
MPPGDGADLDRRDPASTDGAPGDRQATEAALDVQTNRLTTLQDRLWAEGRRSVLVVLQGMDASGKDGTIKHVFRGLNPQGTRVASFKEPTSEELGHDFLFRVHKRVPAAGEIGIFNRSHYEDVLVVRVHRLVEEPVWRSRYELINAFERLLAHGGTTVVKFFLHVSADEQGRRLVERLERPDKRWKTRSSDFSERARWDAYDQAYGEAIAHTSTDISPWHVVPADHKWYRNWVVSEVLLGTLEAMDPQYPAPPAIDSL